MNVATIKNAPEGLTVIRDGSETVLQNGDALRWGDELVNNGDSLVTVSLPAQSDQQTATELTMEPGSKSKLVEKDTPLDDGSSRTEVVAMTDGVELYDVDQEVTTVSGLVGAGLLAAGSGLGAGAVAAGAGAGALGAAFLLDDDDDDDDDGDNPDDPDGSGDAAGAAGGVDSLNESLDQTPLEPVTMLTDPVADGLAGAGTGASDMSEDDPSGLSSIVGGVVGTPEEDYVNDQEGAAGLVGSVSDGIEQGSEGTALDPLLDPVSQTTNELADGVADVGNTLEGDTSPLAPVTSDILAPVVGTDDQGGATGVEGTLSEVGDGLTDLTNPDSPLEPVSALTDPVESEVLGGVEGGVSMVGDAIVDGSADEPSGLGETAGTLLGGESTGGSSGGDTGGSPTDAITDGASGLPTDMLTDAVPTSSITSLPESDDPTSGLTGLA